MSQRNFSFWQVVGMLSLLAVVTAAALAGGVFVGYQWGRAAALSGQPAAVADAGPTMGLPNWGPLTEELAGQPYLGLTYEALTPALAEAEDLPLSGGALVRAVAAGSPAEAAGLQPGDVIEQVNGQTVNAANDLGERVRALAPGDELRLSVRRGAETLDLTATLGTRRALELPDLFGQFGMGPGWTVECAPPEPCRWIPLPDEGQPAPLVEDEPRVSPQKQAPKPAQRADVDDRSVRPGRGRAMGA